VGRRAVTDQLKPQVFDARFFVSFFDRSSRSRTRSYAPDATMSQKHSLLQSAQFVPRVLTVDTCNYPFFVNRIRLIVVLALTLTQQKPPNLGRDAAPVDNRATIAAPSSMGGMAHGQTRPTGPGSPSRKLEIKPNSEPVGGSQTGQPMPVQNLVIAGNASYPAAASTASPETS
jgi:hypothetical protein